MRRILSLALILVGAAVSFWGAHVLLLRSLGTRGAARVVSVETGDATTQVIRQRRSTAKPTGYFRLEIDVRYSFDVPPTPSEALAQASNEPLQRDIRGRDTLHHTVRDPEAQPVSVGDALAVRYWRFLPSINAADQPRSNAVRGAFGFGGGAALLILGWFLRPKARPARAKT